MTTIPPSSFHVGGGLHLPIELYAPSHKKITGPSGFGKSFLAARLWKRTTFGGAPTILLDPVGELYRLAEQEVAAVAALVAREADANDDIPASLKKRVVQRYLSRFHFAYVSSGKPMPVTIDLLKRRTIEGQLETVEHVVDGAMMPFEARFRDMEVRAQFISFSRPMLTCLIASGFNITHHDALIRDPAFWPVVVDKIERSGILDDDTQGNGPYVRQQMQALETEFELRKRAPSQYERHSHSTDNAFKSFEPGTVGGAFFSKDSFRPEDVVFGNHVFALTMDIDSAVERTQFIRSTEGLFQRLAKKRAPGASNRERRLTVFWDEFSKTAYPGAFDWISEARNYRVTYTVMNQSDDQFRSLGMPEMMDILPEIFPLRFEFRTASREIAEKRAMLLGQYDPFALQKVVTVRSTGITEAETETDSESAADTTVNGNSNNTGRNFGRQSSVDLDGNIHITDAEAASDGVGYSGSESRSFVNGSSRSVQKGKSMQEGEQILTAGISDQHTMRSQQLMELPRYTALVTYDDAERTKAAIVLVEPYRPPEVDEFESEDLRRRFGFGRGAASAVNHLTRVDGASEKTADHPVTSAPTAPEQQEAPPRTPAVAPAAPTKREIARPPVTMVPNSTQPGIDALQVVAMIRLCTVQNLMAMLGCNYDKAARELQRLVKSGAVEQIRPLAPRGEGSLPIIFILTAIGARILAERGGDGDDLQRIVKNLGVFRRTVEANRPAQTEHRLWASTLVSLLIRSLSESAKAAVVDVKFDRELSIPVDLSKYTIPDRERVLIGADIAKAVYVPDFSFVARRIRDGKEVRDVVLGEIETGFGERDAFDLGAAKAWKMRAVAAEFSKTQTIAGTTYDPDSELRIVVWNRTAPLEERFFLGTRSVFGDLRSPLWITNGELVPLHTPSGTEKKHRAGAVASLVGNIQARVWRWLRFADPNDRRRFIGTKKTS